MMKRVFFAALALALPAFAFSQTVRPGLTEVEALEGVRLPGLGERPGELAPRLAPVARPATLTEAIRVFEAPKIAAPVRAQVPVLKVAAAPPAFVSAEVPVKPDGPALKQPAEQSEVSPLQQLKNLAAKIQGLEGENAALKQKLEDQSRFVRSAVHDLNNPLSILHGNLSLMEMESQSLGADHQKSLEGAMKGSRRLGALIKSILDYEKAADSSTPLKLAPVDLAGLVRETAAGMSARAAQRGVRVQVDIEPGAHVVQADAELVRRLAENLVSNGIKYNKEGGRLAISVREVRGGRVLSFSDDGIGIKAEDIPKIFGSFFRSDEAKLGNISGNGLGLAGVRAIAERHGGRVEVESVPGHGTTFRVFLPNP